LERWKSVGESVVNMVQELGFWHKHSLSLLSFLLWACPWEHSLDSIAHQHLCISQTHFKYFIAAASSSISKVCYFIASISNCNEKLLEGSFAKQARRIRVLRMSFLQNRMRRWDGAFCNMGEEKGSFAK
jgi:hypothetical protein